MTDPCEVSEKKMCEKAHLLMVLLGKNTRKYRELKGMSRMDLAFFSKTTESVVCKIENGKKDGITIYTISKISESLDVDIKLLFSE